MQIPHSLDYSCLHCDNMHAKCVTKQFKLLFSILYHHFNLRSTIKNFLENFWQTPLNFHYNHWGFWTVADLTIEEGMNLCILSRLMWYHPSPQKWLCQTFLHHQSPLLEETIFQAGHFDCFVCFSVHDIIKEQDWHTFSITKPDVSTQSRTFMLTF